MLRKLLLIASLCLMAAGTAQPLFTPVNTKCTPVPPERACRYVSINSTLLMKSGAPVAYDQLPPLSLSAWNSLGHETADWNAVVSSNGSVNGPLAIPGGWRWIGRYAGKGMSAFMLQYRYGVWSGWFSTDAVEYVLTQHGNLLRVAQFRPPLPGVLPYLMVPNTGGSAAGAAP